VSIALLAGLLVVLAVVLFILQPLLTGEEAPLFGQDDEPTEAEARKRVALLALRDVEYDFATGKLDQGDYEGLRGELAAEALAALNAQDALNTAGQQRDAGTGSSDARLARSLERDDLEAEIARFRAALREGTACAACGEANPAGSRFCGSCGHALPGASSGAGG
jgi:hypothetical protein